MSDLILADRLWTYTILLLLIIISNTTRSQNMWQFKKININHKTMCDATDIWKDNFYTNQSVDTVSNTVYRKILSGQVVDLQFYRAYYNLRMIIIIARRKK